MKPIEDQSTTWIQPEINKEYEPTPSEVEGWEATVARIVRQVEDEATSNDTRAQGSHGSGSVPLKDRSGHLISVYKDSLPPFLQAAAIGQIDILSRMMTEAGDDVNTLLHQCDRHGSIAEHWAAGGGNLECLRLLMESKSSVAGDEPPRPSKRPRRRDGKTCLHYAARNGQLHCIRYLVETQQMDLDEASGEGTTPLHMACYGGHLPAIHYFVEHAAKQSLPNPALAANEWGCQASHWVAMTLNDNAEQVWDMCTYLQGCGVDFGARQLQGHSPLHKAAHRRNRHVLEWMVGAQSALTKEDLVTAAAPDEGGNTPSDIWKSVGGDPDVFKWMKSEGW
jgi:ankyrin repeat protein